MNGRRRVLYGAVAGVAALAGAGGALWRERRAADAAAPDALQAFWPLRFPTPDGGELALAGFRGQPLLLNFWATWCPPCVREMPALDRFQHRHAARGWRVLGLAVDQAEPVREFLRRTPVSFPIGLAGPQGLALSRTLGNSTGALPFTVVFDAAGVVRQRQLGETSEAMLEQFAALL